MGFYKSTDMIEDESKNIPYCPKDERGVPLGLYVDGSVVETRSVASSSVDDDLCADRCCEYCYADAVVTCDECKLIPLCDVCYCDSGRDGMCMVCWEASQVS